MMTERTVAVIDGNTVANVVVVDADWQSDDANEIEYTADRPAGIGWQYDGTGFIPPQPFPSWTLSDYKWHPPTPMPDDGNEYWWDEENTMWHPAD